MSAARSRCSFRLTLAAVALAAMVLAYALACMRAARALSAPAVAALLDELVETHRQQLLAAGDQDALYRSWYTLRADLAVRRLQARASRAGLRVRVELVTFGSRGQTTPETRHYLLTAREDDAWRLDPLPEARWYLPF